MVKLGGNMEVFVVYKWIIFDLDGTLCDSLEDIKNALNSALNDFGYNANYTYQDAKRFIGSGAKVLVERALSKFDSTLSKLDEVLDKYNEIYHKTSMNNLKLFNNVEEVLLKLKKNNFKLGVLSNKPHQDTTKIINAILPGIFDFVQGQVVNVKTKPSKEAILNVCNLYNIKLEEILYVGDMINDMELCQNSGIDFCLCKFGYDTTNSLNNYKYQIDDFNELIQILIN